MTANHTQAIATPSSNLWTYAQICIASFIAGAPAGCYFLARNYTTLGLTKEARYSYMAMIAIFFLQLTVIFFIPESIMEKMPFMMIPMSFSLVAVNFFQSFQKKLITEKLSEGGKRYSYGWCALMVLCLIVIQFPFLLGYTLLLELTFG